MPLTFFGMLNRTLPEKIIIFGLMAAGLGATATACVRVITVLRFYEEYSAALLNARGDLLCGLEMNLGIVGANLPCLKGPAQGFLVRTGLFCRSTSAKGSPDNFLNHFTDGGHIRRQIFRLENSIWNDEERSRSGTETGPSETGIAGQAVTDKAG